MGLITNIIMAMMSGVVAYFAIGLVLGLIPIRRVREAVGGWYLAEAMLLLGRALLVKRKHGGYVLKGSIYDGRETIHLGGDARAFVDETGAMSRLYGMPFGLVHEAADQIWTPFDADLGGTHRELVRGGDFWWTDQTGERRYCGVFPWDERDPALVDMDDVLDLTQGSASPRDKPHAKELMEIAKSAFNRPKIMDDMKFIVAFGAGFGSLFVASRVTDSIGGGGGGIAGSLPIVIDVVGVVV